MTDKGPGKARVYWNNKHRSYICTDCAAAINGAEGSSDDNTDRDWFGETHVRPKFQAD